MLSDVFNSYNECFVAKKTLFDSLPLQHSISVLYYHPFRAISPLSSLFSCLSTPLSSLRSLLSALSSHISPLNILFSAFSPQHSPVSFLHSALSPQLSLLNPLPLSSLFSTLFPSALSSQPSSPQLSHLSPFPLSSLPSALSTPLSPLSYIPKLSLLACLL
jgi:hypothetical protein